MSADPITPGVLLVEAGCLFVAADATHWDHLRCGFVPRPAADLPARLATAAECRAWIAECEATEKAAWEANDRAWEALPSRYAITDYDVFVRAAETFAGALVHRARAMRVTAMARRALALAEAREGGDRL